ncbi:hypothetical protein OG21DRAFT_1485770 [Imleria badia]|nr:hypothetical protein OG21DRAFT_1485770 [Imleria badia]
MQEQVDRFSSWLAELKDTYTDKILGVGKTLKQLDTQGEQIDKLSSSRRGVKVYGDAKASWRRSRPPTPIWSSTLRPRDVPQKATRRREDIHFELEDLDRGRQVGSAGEGIRVAL